MNTTDAYSLARTLMNQHNLGDWVFEFDRAKRRAGCCKHSKKTITLSEYYVRLNSEEEILDTLKHEIAHALVGSKHGHDDVWKAMCVKIGAKPIRCYDSNAVAMPKGRWTATCKGCTKTFHKHRRPKNINGRYCLKCGPVVGSLQYSLTNQQILVR